MPDLMTIDGLWLRRAVVFGSALVYWGGVLLHARRVRRRIRRAPNVAPRGLKETLLWVGWMLVIGVWLGQPLFIGSGSAGWVSQPWVLGGVASGLGVFFLVAGYVGTLACYRAMGTSWRMGVDRAETTELVTRGPYGVVRHPIYLFQIVMLIGAALLLPTALSVGALVLHVACVRIKVADEESYLREAHGGVYRAYVRRTGALLPRARRANRETQPE